MNFRLEVVCINDDGEEQRGEVLTMERRQLAMETLGLNQSSGEPALRQETTNALDSSRRAPVAANPNEGLEQRTGGRVPAVVSAVPP